VEVNSKKLHILFSIFFSFLIGRIYSLAYIRAIKNMYEYIKTTMISIEICIMISTSLLKKKVMVNERLIKLLVSELIFGIHVDPLNFKKCYFDLFNLD